jgi:hypothetical protein
VGRRDGMSAKQDHRHHAAGGHTSGALVERDWGTALWAGAFAAE